MVFDTPWGPNKDVNTIPNLINCKEKTTTNMLKIKYMLLYDFFRFTMNTTFDYCIYLLTLALIWCSTIKTRHTEFSSYIFEIFGYLICQFPCWSQNKYLSKKFKKQRYTFFKDWYKCNLKGHFCKDAFRVRISTLSSDKAGHIVSGKLTSSMHKLGLIPSPGVWEQRIQILIIRTVYIYYNIFYQISKVIFLGWE